MIVKRELVPRYVTSQFYGRARIVEQGGRQTLYSCKKEICRIRDLRIEYLTTNPKHYTYETLEHLNEFLAQAGFRIDLNKRDFLEIANRLRGDKTDEIADFNRGQGFAWADR